MQKQKLISLIEQLEKELEISSSIDHELIKNISQDLDKLKNWQPDHEVHEKDQLLEAAVHFEEEHPKAASIINDIAYLLTNIGI